MPRIERINLLHRRFSIAIHSSCRSFERRELLPAPLRPHASHLTRSRHICTFNDAQDREGEEDRREGRRERQKEGALIVVVQNSRAIGPIKTVTYRFLPCLLSPLLTYWLTFFLILFHDHSSQEHVTWPSGILASFLRY